MELGVIVILQIIDGNMSTQFLPVLIMANLSLIVHPFTHTRTLGKVGGVKFLINGTLCVTLKIIGVPLLLSADDDNTISRNNFLSQNFDYHGCILF